MLRLDGFPDIDGKASGRALKEIARNRRDVVPVTSLNQRPANDGRERVCLEAFLNDTGVRRPSFEPGIVEASGVEESGNSFRNLWTALFPSPTYPCRGRRLSSR